MAAFLVSSCARFPTWQDASNLHEAGVIFTMGRKLRPLKLLVLPTKHAETQNELPLTGYIELHAGIFADAARSGPVLVVRLGKSSQSTINDGSGVAFHKERRGCCSRLGASIRRCCCCVCLPCCRPDDHPQLQSESKDSWQQSFESEEQMLTIPVEDVLSIKAKALVKTSNNESRVDTVSTTVERGTCCGCFPTQKIIPHPSSDVDAISKAERRVS